MSPPVPKFGEGSDINSLHEYLYIDTTLTHHVDLREQYEVRMDEGLDTFVVVDGLPKVPPASKDKLTKLDRKSTRLNSSHSGESRMPSSA